jgi:hypothetical protein
MGEQDRCLDSGTPEEQNTERAELHHIEYHLAFAVRT